MVRTKPHCFVQHLGNRMPLIVLHEPVIASQPPPGKKKGFKSPLAACGWSTLSLRNPAALRANVSLPALSSFPVAQRPCADGKSCEDERAFFFPRLFCACMSRSGSLAAPVAVVGQAFPSAVVPTACCTATARRPHQRRAHPLAALRRTAAGGDSGGAPGCAGSCAPPSSSAHHLRARGNVAGPGRRARGHNRPCF